MSCTLPTPLLNISLYLLEKPLEWASNSPLLTYAQIQKTPLTKKISSIFFLTFIYVGTIVAGGAAVTAVGATLGAVSPLVGSGALASLAAKITVFGKSTMLFPVYTAPKAIFFASVQGYHFIAPKAAIVANQIFTEVIIPAAVATKYYFNLTLANTTYAYHTWVIPATNQAFTKTTEIVFKAIALMTSLLKAS